MRLARVLGRVYPCAWLLIPTSCAVGFASLLTLFEASTPGLSFWAATWLPLCWLALAIWLAWMSVSAVRRRAWTYWMFVPLALVLGTVLLIKIDAPFHARFAMSESSLERHARSVRGDHDGDEWWGLYQVDHVQKIPGGARFLITSLTLDWQSYGFAYSPDRAPDPDVASTSTSRALGTSGWRESERCQSLKVVRGVRAGSARRSPLSSVSTRAPCHHSSDRFINCE